MLYLKETLMAITIRRGKMPSDNFTIVANAYARDGRISWEAFGLLVWLMGHGSTFVITQESMISQRSMGRDGIRRMLRELEDCGYLTRDRVIKPGSGSEVVYILHDPSDGHASPQEVAPAVAQPDQASDDETAGQPDGGYAVPLPIKEQEKTTKTTSSSMRATRLPENFQPSPAMVAWFVAEQLGTSINGKTEHAKFCDYFAGAPGVKGRKVDWPATWRNWMRTAAERAGRRPGSSLVPSSSSNPSVSKTNDRVLQGLNLAAKYEEQGR